MKVNIKQISDVTGFSAATISNALNGKRGVNKDTAEQIFTVAKRLGYVTEKKINKIKLVVCKKTGDVVTDTPFFLDLLAGMERTGREFGYDTVVTNLSLSDAEEIEQLKREVTTGVILLATELSEEDMKQFDDCEAPLVVIDSWYDNMKYDSVLISNTDSVCQAVEYLFDKGHERVGYLKGTDRITNFYYRQLGFERAHQKRKKPLHSEYDVEIRPMADIAYQDMKQYLEGMKKKSEDLHTVLPTAYFADNDIIAIGALKALQEAGIRVPEDVSLIGFDDMPFCEMSSPKLTTIRVFKQEMGMIAVKRLLEHLAEAKVINTKIQVCTQFIERESVRKLP
ncbi:MAG: LacI family transcriptional regulator [Lachnospiraceae bacterium]|jgi:DNA-binding LacI/PurR family transcriptional regulator|nr:LacI family transcriptional regulator [Lachnospiraceae bacterium]MCX4315601.1 LacI family DNA-binding transcriptional regulator [Lachnospiraceae bacterium]